MKSMNAPQSSAGPSAEGLRNADGLVCRIADRRSAKPSMRAAVLENPTMFSVRKVQTPKPADNQALIRLEGCGVCGSNLAPWEGRPWFKYPIDAGAPGHEGWGYVEDI